MISKWNKKQQKKHLKIFFQLNEAYEEVDEQKRDVAGWKKKTQKAKANNCPVFVSLEMLKL